MEPASGHDELQSKILHDTLHEVALRNEQTNDCCVICLDAIVDPCEVQPCGHHNFDYACVANWLYNTPHCPLCKAKTVSVRHGNPVGTLTTAFDGEFKPKPPPIPTDPPAPPQNLPHRPLFRYQRYRHRTHYERTQPVLFNEMMHHVDFESIISQREEIYRHKRYAKHVGSNRVSRYRELTPLLFCVDTDIVSRARMFIRRELKVFKHLRINNVEFLLEYIVAILKSVDIMGSGGQAVNMLSDFLGAENARLFLHELRAWLRSPFSKLEDWDETVQYDRGPVPRYGEGARSPEPETRRGRNRDRYVSERYRNRYARRGDRWRVRDVYRADLKRPGGLKSEGRSLRYDPFANSRLERQ